jgi:hypothetical protein
MRRSPFFVVLLVAVLAAALTGCSRVPTAPSAGSTSAVAPASDPVVIGRVDDPPSPVESGSGALAHITLKVGEAGIVECGPFRLFIHKNSLKQDATIIMSQPDRNVMQVEFEVLPASANDFQVPLKLTALCADDTPASVKDEAPYLWDGQWTQVRKQDVSYDGVTITTTSLKTLATAKIAPATGGATAISAN